jgi:hypothetical protein
MKRLVLSALVLLMSASAFAGQRAFRIQGSMGTAGSLALAYGIQGKSIDFEAAEADKKKSEETLNELFEKGSMFLVNMDRDQVIENLTASGDALGNITGVFGDSGMGNHFHMSLNRVLVENAYGDAASIYYGYKWFGGIGDIVLMNDAGTKIIARAKNVQETLDKQALALLPASQQKKAERLSANSIDTFQTITTPKGEVLNSYVQHLSSGKNEPFEDLDYRVVFKAKQNGSKIDVKVVSAKILILN